MAQLWTQDQSAGGWVLMPLTEGAFVLSDGHHPGARRNADAGAGAALLLRSRGPEGDVWLVMSASPNGVRLNGGSLHTGIRALRDHDELLVDGLGRVFFSTEQLARIEPFPGAQRAAFCPRCKQEIDTHCQSVRCPHCGVWYHQSEELPCWTYAQTCALCDQPTDLGAGYRWTPEEL
jgi:hypothetical protein